MPNKLSQMGKKNNGANFNFSLTNSLNEGATGVMDDLGVISGVGTLGCPQVMSLAGIDEMDDFEYEEYLGRYERLEGLGMIGKRKKKTKEERKEKRKKIFDKIKGGVNTVATKAFLILIRAGKLTQNTKLKLNLANKFALAWQKNPDNVKSMWKKFGGNPDDLRKAIIEGTGQRLASLESLGVVTLATILGAITVSTPVLVGSYKLLKDSGLLTKQEESDGADVIDEGEDEHNERGEPPTNKTNIVIKNRDTVTRGEDSDNAPTPNLGGIDLSALTQHPANILTKGFMYAFAASNIFPVAAPVFSILYIASVTVTFINYFSPRFKLKKIFSHG